ncbi:CotH kinase family protein [Aeromicrobium sp.]|uniref:CotH kinase family protein n=1 Tax=Aeromicrobium sp. TaxID=1871063 RepID=UPI003D6B33AA
MRTIVPAAPNDVTGGPNEKGRNVIYVTTNSGKTPVTKGVDYKGKAVLTSNEVATETFDLETIAVRGNSSADKPKKPYKLKFDSKQKPFGMKSDKTWILLANYVDWTLVRSMVAWDLGRKLLGLKWTPNSTFAELYINGKYLGSYQMVESIKIDSNRVNVSKTTGQVIEFDPHYKEDGVPGMVGKTGVKYAWKDPDEFKTLDDGNEDPEGLTNAKISAMKSKIRKFEDVLYGPTGSRNWATYQPSTPASDWTTHLDMSSAVDYYLAREFTKDQDADMYRSNFFYTNNVDPASVDKFFMGPIWDFDRSAGAKHPSDTTVDQPTGWWMRGGDSSFHNTTNIHWYTRITDDPRFLEALRVRWAETKQHFAAVGPDGVSAAVRKLGGDQAGLNEPDVPDDPDLALGKQVAANDRARWEGYGSRYDPRSSTYTGELNWVRDWYEKRYAWMDARLS